MAIATVTQVGAHVRTYRAGGKGQRDPTIHKQQLNGDVNLR